MPVVVLSKAEEKENLKALVALLNDRRSAAQAWQESGYDASEETARLRRLIRAWQAMMNITHGHQNLSRMKLSPEDRQTLDQFAAQGLQASIYPDGSLVVIDSFPHPYDRAAIEFTRFLRNARQSFLGGPCEGIKQGAVCERWFLKKDARQEFCGPRCAATARQARRRSEVRRGKLDEARKAIVNFQVRPARMKAMDWKEYVKQATGISKRFLTLAVENGELFAPKGDQHATKH